MTQRYTPWGQADHEQVLEWAQDGDTHQMFPIIISVSTPGHGGIGVLREVAHLLLTPEAIAEGNSQGLWLWYEEDCDAVIVLYEREPARNVFFAGREAGNPYATDTTRMPRLLNSLSRNHLTYLRARGITPDPEGQADAEAREEDARRRASKDSDLVVAAWGDWDDRVPKGAVGLLTADEKFHLVVAEDYAYENRKHHRLNLLSNYRTFEPVVA